MALNQTETFGANFVFGFPGIAPALPSIAAFAPRSITTSDTTPEVTVTATNGEGVTESIAISKPAFRMRSISISGYVTPNFQKNAVATQFQYDGRWFFMTKISDPTPKGNFMEVTIDATHYPLIDTGTAN